MSQISGNKPSGTGDLEAQRRAQEEARRRAEEARRRAEEARRKAEEEAKRKAEEAARKKAEAEAQKKAQEEAKKKAAERQDGYNAKGTQPLSAETARLQGIAAQYGPPAPVSKSPKLDAAKAEAAGKDAGMDRRMEEAKDKYPDASGDAKDKAAEIQREAKSEAAKVRSAATEEADKLIKEAETFAADKKPEDQAKIMAEADTRATAIVERANDAADAILDKAADIGTEVLEKSHDYENKNWFQKRAADLGNFVGDAWDKAKDLFSSATDTVGDIKSFAVEQAGDFKDWVGDQAFKVADSALDKTALGEDNEYTQEKTGVLGDLVTNRLEVGESAYVKLDADANINGVALGAGAELSIKRVPATNDDGTPKLEPKDEHGEPPTELEVTLVVDANAGVGLEAEFGVSGAKSTGKSVAGNDIAPGAQAGVGASAEAGVQAEAEFKFTFDPNSQKDMDDLTGIVGATAKTALPGVGALFAGDAAKAAANFGSHLTSIRGQVGVYASAQASASASAGMGSTEDNGAGGEIRRSGVDGKEGQLAARGNRVIDPNAPAEEAEEGPDYGLKGTAAGEALSAANVNLGELTAGINGEVNVGAEHNFRTGETTVYLNVAASAEASASTVGDLSAGAGAATDRTIAVRIKDGKLQGIDVTEKMSGEKFKGVGITDVRGRLQDDVLAQVSESDEVAITRSFTPEAMDTLRKNAGGNPTKALGTVVGAMFGNGKTNGNLEVTDVKATHQDEVSVGFKVAGTGIRISAGHRLESDLDTVEAPHNRNAAARAGKPRATAS